MSLMKQIQKGRQPMPPRLVVYGTEGIGKSTFAASHGLFVSKAGNWANKR